MTSYQVTAQSLNIRQQPGVEGAILGVLAYGEAVQATSAPLANEYWRQIQHAGQTGWVSDKYLRLVGNDPCPWMPIALAENGVTEIVGEKHSPRVLEYLRSTTLSESQSGQDETPWCSAFVNWCMEKAGFAGTDSAWARDWLHWGRKLDTPQHGCIVVFQRYCEGISSGPKNCGHVGFYRGEASTTTIEVLGGNQGNRVCSKSYPKADVLGYRLPSRL